MKTHPDIKFEDIEVKIEEMMNKKKINEHK